MITRFIHSDDMAAELTRLIRNYAELYLAVAWGSGSHSIAGTLLRNRRKIRRLIIGTHFFQTDPAFLEQFEDASYARAALQMNKGVFHPKIYLCISGNRAAAIIGSANFTRAAFTKNTEACVLLEGTRCEAIFSEIKEFVEGTCWMHGKEIDADFLREYRIQYEATQRAREILQQFRHLRRPTSAGVDDPLEMDWSTFVAKVRADQHHSAEQRAEVLAMTRLLFESQLHFSDLQPIERKAIAGTLGKNERARDFGFYEWGWFGTTGAFGIFKNRVNENVPEISAALDWIPLNGPVSDGNYQRFVETFLKAFEGSPRQPGIAHASRLLAMKRPDYFVSFNEPNSRGLSAHFGVPASSINLSTYWTDIIEPITYSKWWRSPRPRGVDGRIWDGRAAFLDALYY